MTNLPAMLHLVIIIFCATGTCTTIVVCSFVRLFVCLFVDLSAAQELPGEDASNVSNTLYIYLPFT